MKNELDEKVNIIIVKDGRLRKCFVPLYKYIRGSSADCLITGPTYPNIIALICNFLAFYKMRIIVNQHNYQDIEMKNLGFIGRLAPFLIRHTYNYATKVVAVSEGVKTDLINNYNIRPDKIVTIYNAVLDDTFFSKAKAEIDAFIVHSLLSKKYIIAIGRLEVVKNYSFILKTFSRLKESFPEFNYDLIILGEGAERMKLENEIIKLNLENSVYLLGSFANPLPILKGAKLLVHSSLSESMGLVYVEALALKVPVLTITNSGAEEILEGIIPKEIISSYDEEKFASSIVKMLNRKFNDDEFPRLDQFKSEKIRDHFLRII